MALSLAENGVRCVPPSKCRDATTRRLSATPGVALASRDGQLARALVVGDGPAETLVRAVAHHLEAAVVSTLSLWSPATHTLSSAPLRKYVDSLLMVGEHISRVVSESTHRPCTRGFISYFLTQSRSHRCMAATHGRSRTTPARTGVGSGRTIHACLAAAWLRLRMLPGGHPY
eukprot:4185061-Prymnesium_polylepis.2